MFLPVMFFVIVILPCWLVFSIILVSARRWRHLASYVFLPVAGALAAPLLIAILFRPLFVLSDHFRFPSPEAGALIMVPVLFTALFAGFLGGVFAAPKLNARFHLPPTGLYADEERFLWWEGRRRAYNLWMAAAGWAAYFIAFAIHPNRGGVNELKQADIVFGLGMGYLLLMGGANLCFLLGPAAEEMVPPAYRQTYRRWSYRAGLTFSCLIPQALFVLASTIN